VAYIFGSMHYGRESWFPLHETVEAAMRRSDVFAFEMDLTPEMEMQMALYAMEYMFLRDDMTWEELLPEDVLETFLANLETFGISYGEVSMLTPFVTSILALEIPYGMVGIYGEHGIDYYVRDFAVERGLPIIGLNPLEHEANLAFNVSDEIQIYAAADFTDLDTAIEQVERLTRAYETQDIAQITYLLREADYEENADNPLVRYMVDVILIQRSIEFAQEIIRLLQETEAPTTFFVTMGIGHMVGQDHGNVFVYLADAGFEIMPLYRLAIPDI